MECEGRTRRPLHASGSAESDRHLPVLDDDGNVAAAFRVAEHPVEPGGALVDVDVLERDLPPLTVLTGGLRIRSGVLAEDVDHGVSVAFVHGRWLMPHG